MLAPDTLPVMAESRVCADTRLRSRSFTTEAPLAVLVFMRTGARPVMTMVSPTTGTTTTSIEVWVSGTGTSFTSWFGPVTTRVTGPGGTFSSVKVPPSSAMAATSLSFTCTVAPMTPSFEVDSVTVPVMVRPAAGCGCSGCSGPVAPAAARVSLAEVSVAGSGAVAWRPSASATSSMSPAGAFWMTNRPSASVTALSCVPLTVTVAPTTA